MTAGCWADPLTTVERRILAAMLARAGRRLYGAAFVPKVSPKAATMRQLASADMCDLRVDVTERAAVARV